MGRSAADQHGVTFFETSAKEGINVNDALMSVTRAILARPDFASSTGDGDIAHDDDDAAASGKAKGKKDCVVM